MARGHGQEGSSGNAGPGGPIPLLSPRRNGNGNTNLRSAFGDPLELKEQIPRCLQSLPRILAQAALDDVIQRWRRHRLCLGDGLGINTLDGSDQ